MIEGKLPPQNLEAEAAVISAILIESACMNTVVAYLHENCFYTNANKLIFSAALHLFNNSQKIDILTVSSHLKAKAMLDAVGGNYGVISASNAVSSTAHVEEHCLLVKECYLRRKLIEVNNRAINSMFNDTVDFFDGFDAMLNEVELVNRELNRIKQVNFSDAVVARAAQIKEAGLTKTYKTGIGTQLDAFDKQTMGFQPGNLIIIAARPAMGKTALAVDFMRYQSSSDIPVGMFSLEMSMDELIDRMFSSESQVDLRQIRKGGMNGGDWQRFDMATDKVQGYPVWICDKGGMNINEIISIAKEWKLRHSIQILYIDYLQLINGSFKKNGNREQEISEVSRRLKALAKELNIPVVALAQLSRSCESRPDKRPMLSDIRESGGIEQDADMVIFPYRDHYYNETADPELCELIIAKYRNGQTGTVLCNFHGETQKFTNSNTPF